MTEEELKKAKASRNRQASQAKVEAQRRNGKQARKQAVRLARQRKPDTTLPPDGTGRLYTHNSQKPHAAYHVATALGTVCKLENSKFMKYQDSVTEAPPRGKRLCSMCSAALAGKETEAAVWDRLNAF